MAELAGSAASLADFIWKNAEDIWGDFKHTDFGKIILPFALLRADWNASLSRCIRKSVMLYEVHKEFGVDLDLILHHITRYPFYNTSEYALNTLDGTKTRQNLQDYIALSTMHASGRSCCPRRRIRDEPLQTLSDLQGFRS